MTLTDNILSKERIPKLFIKYCFPAVIAMIISGLQGMIDGMFVGNYVGSNALASVNIAMPFMQLIVGVSMIISIGSQSYIGLNLGKDNREKAQNCFNTFKIIIFVCAALITLLGLTLSSQIAVLLGADETLLAGSATYIKYISIFAIPMCMMFYIGFLNRIVGEPEKYFYGSMLSIIVNVSLDYLFVARLGLGVMGAALATGTAYVAALFVVIWPMLKRSNVINLYVGKFSGESILSVLYNGSSEGINSISIAVTIFLFNAALMSVAGPDGVAAFTAINYVGTFGGMLLFGVSDGIGPIVSYNYGTQDTKRVKALMTLSYICNFVFGVGLFLLLFFGGEWLVGLFIKDNAALVSLAASGGKIYALSFLLSGFNILTSGYFTFIGKGLESVMVAASRGLIFVVIGITMLPNYFEIDGIWLSVPFAEACTFIVSLVLLKVTAKKASPKSSLALYDEKMSQEAQGANAALLHSSCDRIITVNRQFGSGGREVAKKLADSLGCAYFDKELISFISESSGLSPDLIGKLDEISEKDYTYTFSRSFMKYGRLPLGEIKTAETMILKELAEGSKGVYVGRCASHVLSEYNPLKVFIFSSDMNYKVERCIERDPEILKTKTHDQIEREITAIDDKRKAYFKANTGLEWDDVEHYNLCIDTSKVGVNGAVELITCSLKSEGVAEKAV